jgi:hypothetical protein
MDRYLDELEFRFNNRENRFLFRDTLLRLIASPNMENKELTKKEKAAQLLLSSPNALVLFRAWQSFR